MHTVCHYITTFHQWKNCWFLNVRTFCKYIIIFFNYYFVFIIGNVLKCYIKMKQSKDIGCELGYLWIVYPGIQNSLAHKSRNSGTERYKNEQYKHSYCNINCIIRVQALDSFFMTKIFLFSSFCFTWYCANYKSRWKFHFLIRALSVITTRSSEGNFIIHIITNAALL